MKNLKNTILYLSLTNRSLSNLAIHALLYPLIVFYFIVMTACEDVKPSEKKYRVIGISQIIEHDALDRVRESAIKTLEQEGFQVGENLKIVSLNAQGSLASNMQIAQTLSSLKPDAILAISTPSAQSLKSIAQSQNIPVVFAAVTDALSAHLSTQRERPDKNMTGIEDKPSLEQQLALIKQIVAHVQRIGVLYNPGETNSVLMIQEMRALAKNHQIILKEGVVNKPADLSMVFYSLADEVEALYVPLDNTIVALMPQLSRLAIEKKLPLIAADSGSVRHGALATYGFSYEDCGTEAGHYLAQILKGESVQNLPIKSPSSQGIYMNKNTVKALHLDLVPHHFNPIKEMIF